MCAYFDQTTIYLEFSLLFNFPLVSNIVLEKNKLISLIFQVLLKLLPKKHHKCVQLLPLMTYSRSSSINDSNIYSSNHFKTLFAHAIKYKENVTDLLICSSCETSWKCMNIVNETELDM